MEGHDFVGGADEVAADEDRRHGGVAAHPGQGSLHFFPVLVVGVDVVHVGLHAQLLEQDVHRVAQTTCGFAKDHYAVLGRQAFYLFHSIYTPELP